MSELKNWTKIWKINVITMSECGISTSNGEFIFNSNLPTQEYEIGDFNSSALTRHATLLLKQYAYQLYAHLTNGANCLLQITYFPCDDYMCEDEVINWDPLWELNNSVVENVTETFDYTSNALAPKVVTVDMNLFKIAGDYETKQSHTSVENCDYSDDSMTLGFYKDKDNETNWYVNTTYVSEFSSDTEYKDVSVHTIRGDVEKLITIKRFINGVLREVL